MEVWEEAFIDRTYEMDGSLTSRKKPNSVIQDEKEALKQALDIIENGKVTAVNGEKVILQAQTLCIHGDNPNALKFIKAIHSTR